MAPAVPSRPATRSPPRSSPRTPGAGPRLDPPRRRRVRLNNAKEEFLAPFATGAPKRAGLPDDWQEAVLQVIRRERDAGLRYRSRSARTACGARPTATYRATSFAGGATTGELPNLGLLETGIHGQEGFEQER